MTHELEHVRHRPVASRTLIRYLTAALSAVVAVLYLVLFFLVSRAESLPGAVVTDTTYGAYLFLAVPYLAGAFLLVVSDRRIVWALGAVVQVLALVLFLLFGLGAFGPGVFEYQAVSHLRMELWAGAITGAQAVLFGLLVYLAVAVRRPAGVP